MGSTLSWCYATEEVADVGELNGSIFTLLDKLTSQADDTLNAYERIVILEG